MFGTYLELLEGLGDPQIDRAYEGLGTPWQALNLSDDLPLLVLPGLVRGRLIPESSLGHRIGHLERPV